MRAFMILICASIAAWCAVDYARSTESVGFDIAGWGVIYSYPNSVALGGAILFGILAIALAIEGFAIAKKAAAPPSAPSQQQFIVIPPWQAPPQAPTSGGKSN